MFWASVAGGLDVLLHWEAWAASGLFVLLLVVPMILVGLAASKNMGLGCAGMLVLPVFQALATLMVMLTLSPIILGLSEDAYWGAPWRMLLSAPGPMIKGALFLTFVALVSAFVPILGRIGTFTSMVLGSFAIAGTAGGLLAATKPDLLDSLDYWPPLLYVLGFLVVGGMATMMSTFIVAVVANLRADAGEEPSPGPITIAVFNVLGLIPAFMYGAWLGEQIRSLAS